MYDAITVGSNTLDIFAHTDRAQIIDICSKPVNEEFISYPVGSKILINKFLHNFGGNGANTAVCFSRLGLKTGYVGKIGTDLNGKLIAENLRKEKISFLGSKGTESGLSIVLDAKEEDRTILVYKGCNNELSLDEINMSRLKTRWLYVSSMLGKSLETMHAIVAYAKKNNIKVAFNPSATLLENETKKALDLVRYSDALVLNKEEAECLVGKNIAEVNIMKLKVLGPSIVVITDGKNGAIGYREGYYYKVLPDKNLKLVETTGAGDAFASTLTAGLIMKRPFEQCMKMAILNSESVICHHGAQNKLLTKAELQKAMSKDKRIVEKRKAVT